MAESAQYRAFAEAVTGPDFDLARAALTIAQAEYPELDVTGHLEQLRRLADRVADAAGAEDGAYRRLACVDYVLFRQEGFKGNEDDYYDPENSFLNRVMERRRGIPITLSVLYMEVARRAGLDAQGVGFPGHFLVKTVCEDQEVFVDPFHGASILSPSDLQGLLDKLYGGRLEVQPEFLSAVSKRQIVQRMLNNIKLIYSNRQDLKRCLRTVEHLVILNPDDADQVRDRGLLRLRLEDSAGALADFERCLELAPDAASAQTVREQIERIRRRSRALH